MIVQRPQHKCNSYKEDILLLADNQMKEKSIYANTFQCSTCVITSSLSLAKPSHMTKPKLGCRKNAYSANPVTMAMGRKCESIS